MNSAWQVQVRGNESAMSAPWRQLHIVIVSYRTPALEVERLAACLAQLQSQIGFSVVVNAHRAGEPIEALADQADLFLTTRKNLGYGRAVNWAVSSLVSKANELGCEPAGWVAAINTDITWKPGSFESLVSWLAGQPEIVLAVPQILSPAGHVQRLCKTDPTVLALLSRRFLPQWVKPRWLRRLDQRYVMSDSCLDQVIDVEYLSGCCMVIRRQAFVRAGGFDPRYFLYLEDADMTRTMRRMGRCVHAPVMQITHAWGRGNYRSLWLTLVNIHSSWLYFCKWGWR